jgi:hypothetical protein
MPGEGTVPFERRTLRALACACCVYLQLAAPVAAQVVPVPSRWSGEVTGRVHEATFRLPVVIEFGPPLPEERNPFHLYVGTGGTDEVGAVGLFSAQVFRTPQTGRRATLQYFTIRTDRNTIDGRLTADHRAVGAVVNNFTAPNLTRLHAPAVMREIYAVFGDTEYFAFHEGSSLSLRVDGEQLQGRIEGTGYSHTGIFPLPDVVYRATLQARRIR